MKRTQEVLKEASRELSAFWCMPEANILRDQTTHCLVLVDQTDERHHQILRRLGCEPNVQMGVSRWSTLVLPLSDFRQDIREEAAGKRTTDRYPAILLSDGIVYVTGIGDGMQARQVRDQVPDRTSN